MPPPAIQMVKQCGWWSRPRNFEPPRASFIEVRPNSPPQMTSVSSSRPRRFRSVQQGRDRAGRSPCTSSAGAVTMSSPGPVPWHVPAPVVELDEAHAALDQPAGQQAVVGERRRRPARRRTASSVFFGSCLMSITSGTAICIRKASSYWLIRVSVSGSPNCFSSTSLSCLSASRLRRRHVAVHALGVVDVQDRVAGRCGTARPGRREGRKPVLHRRLAAGRVGAAADEDDEAGQVLVLGAEAVGDPRAHRRAAVARASRCRGTARPGRG